MIMLRFSVLLALLLSGCAGSHGFDRNAMRAAFHLDAGAIDEQNMAATATEKPTTPMPFRLALYFVQRDFPVHHTIQKAEWVSADKNALTNWLAPLRDERIVTDTFLLVDPTIQGNDARKVRQAAARYGADVVIIVDGVGAVDRYNNGYAALYPTLFGAYLAPGTHSDALFMVEGTLWDVRSERLSETQTVEGHAQAVGPATSVEDAQVLARAKKAAVDELGKRMVARLRALKDSMQRVNDRLR